jgi:hypothetical protein
MPKPHDGRPEQQGSLAMDDQDTLFTSPAKREPWNKGKFTGAKPPRGHFHHPHRTYSVICHCAKRNLDEVVDWLFDRVLDSFR